MAQNPTLLILLTLLSATAFTAILVFSGLHGIPDNGLFNHTIGYVSGKYETDLTPAGYAFSIWWLIYLWQAAWISYALSALCRTNNQGLVFMNPVVLPNEFHILWMVSCAGTIAWMFIWDKELLLLAAIDLVLLTVFGYGALTVNSVIILKYAPTLNEVSKNDLICIRVLIQNGLDLFFSWTTVASLIGVSAALTYDSVSPWTMSREASGTLCLSVLGVCIVMYSFMENTRWFELFKYAYGWYIAVIWALIGMIVRNPDTSNKNTIITISLLCVAVICLVAKILVIFCAPPNKGKKYRRFWNVQ